MAARFVDKEYGASTTTAIANDTTGTRKVKDLPDAVGLVFDKVDKLFKYNDAGTIKALGGAAETYFTSTAGNGTANGATVSAAETIRGAVHKTTLTLTATPLAISDANAYAGVKVYDFPEGVIAIRGAYASLAETTTSDPTTTLNASAVLGTALGSATAAANPLVTTQKNILDLFNVTASASQNVAGTAAASSTLTTQTTLGGHATAADLYLNVQVTTNTEIDADATTTWTGTIVVFWENLGDF